MKLITIVLFSLLLTIQLSLADTKISQLPLGTASSVGSTDSFPYVDVADNATKRLTLGTITQLPALADPSYVTSKLLTGFTSSVGTVTASDTVLSAIGKLAGTSTPGAPVTVGTYGSQAASANGLTITSNVIYAQSADATHPGMLSTGTQTIAGAKTFSGGVTAALTGNASTSTAFDHSPTGCAGGQFATAIDSGGNLTCSTPTGSGDVSGPGSSTDNAVARFDSTTGKIIQNSAVIVDDSGNISGIGTFNGSGTATIGNVIDSGLTTNTAVYANGSKQLTSSSTTNTQLGYLSGASGTTGTGNLVFSSSPSFTTPSLGAATATSVNGFAPSCSATTCSLQIVSGKSVVIDNSLQLAGTDGATIDFGAGGTIGAVGYSTTPLGVALGGSGRTSLTSHGVIVGAGTSAVTQLSAAAAGTVLTGQGAAADPSFSATPTLGVAGTTKGTLAFTGNTSGTITVQPQAAAGTYNFNLPITAGTSGQPLISGGGSTTAMGWGSISGNTSTFATTSGSLTNGNCVKIDASGNLVDAGSACGGGAGGTSHGARFVCGQGVADANTLSLANYDASTVNDYGSVSSGSSWTISGSCTSNSASAAKFGTGGLSCTSNGSITSPTNSIMGSVGTGNYTYDFWFNSPNTWGGSDLGFFGNGGGVGTGTGGLAWKASTQKFQYWVSNSQAVLSSVQSLSTNTWYHFAVVRNSGTVTLYLNGVSIGSGAETSDMSNGNTIAVGYAQYDAVYFNGFIDEFRISNNARWTTGFTPPSSAYSITNTISVNPSSWISSVSGGATAGNCTVNVATPFAAEPICTCTVISSNTGENTCALSAAASTSAIPLFVRIGGAAANSNQVYLNCLEQ